MSATISGVELPAVAERNIASAELLLLRARCREREMIENRRAAWVMLAAARAACTTAEHENEIFERFLKEFNISSEGNQ